MTNVRVIPNPGHDSICLEGLTEEETRYVLLNIDPADCEICGIVRKARSEERASLQPPYMSTEWHAGYRQAKDDVVKKIQGMLWPIGASKEYVISFIRK